LSNCKKRTAKKHQMGLAGGGNDRGYKNPNIFVAVISLYCS